MDNKTEMKREVVRMLTELAKMKIRLRNDLTQLDELMSHLEYYCANGKLPNQNEEDN